MKKQLQLKTPAGEAFIDPDLHYWVPVGDDSFLRKKGWDLNVGDIVPCVIQPHNFSLGELELYILEEPRYRRAREDLHFINKYGKTVTKLRALALRGMTGNDTTLEERIMLEGSDFTQEEYRQFKSAVQGIVNVGVDSVRDWLKNEVVAPQDWNNFLLLAQINPEFRAIYESFGKALGFHSSYRFYTDLRRYVRRPSEGKKAALELGPEATKVNGQESEYFRILRQVASRLYTAISDTLNGVRILEIKVVEFEDEATKKIEADTSKLARIFSGKPNGKREADLSSVLDMESVLRECWGNALHLYFSKIHGFDISSPRKTDIVYLELAGYFVLLATVAMIPNSPLERRMYFEPHYLIKEIVSQQHKDHEYRETWNELVEKGVVRLKQDIGTGKADEIIGVETYNLSDLAYALSRIRSVIPASYSRWEAMQADETRLTAILNPGAIVQRGRFMSMSLPSADDNLNRKKRREFSREIEKLQESAAKLGRYLHEEYGDFKRRLFGHEMLPYSVRDPQDRMWAMMEFSKAGIEFFTASGVAAMLADHNFSAFEKFISRNDVL